MLSRWFFRLTLGQGCCDFFLERINPPFKGSAFLYAVQDDSKLLLILSNSFVLAPIIWHLLRMWHCGAVRHAFLLSTIIHHLLILAGNTYSGIKTTFLVPLQQEMSKLWPIGSSASASRKYS